MTETSDTGEARPRRRKRRIARNVVLVILVLIALAALALYMMRRSIAENIIESELEKRGVEASYTLERVGFRTQILRDIRLGPKDDPDFTLDYLKVQLRPQITGKIDIYRVVARGLRGTVRVREDGSFDLGELDKLLPEPSGEPFSLPDIAVDLADARLGVRTPFGVAGIAARGTGNLTGGFAGQLAVSADRLTPGDCTLRDLGGKVDIAITARSPSIDGPLRLGSIACASGLSGDQLIANVDVTANEQFDRLRDSSLRLSAERLAAGPDTALGDVNLRIVARGAIDALDGRYNLGAGDVLLAGLSADRLRAAGAYSANLPAMTGAIEGDASLGGMTIDNAAQAGFDAALRGLAGTPLAPVAVKLSRAVDANLKSLSADTSFSLAYDEDGLSGQVSRLVASSGAGGQLALEGRGLVISPSGIEIDGALTLKGGGLPSMTSTLRQEGDRLVGEIDVAPYRAGSSSVEVSDLGFTRFASGLITFDGRARISGPVSSGRVEGLEIPVSGRIGADGRVSLGEGCVPVAFQSLSIGSFDFARTRLTLCGDKGAILQTGTGGTQIGFSTRDVALNGSLGGNPFSLDAGRFALSGERFTAANVNAVLGNPASPIRIGAETIEGFLSGGQYGTLAGGTATIGSVPILISEMVGDWRISEGDIFLEGDFTVSDREDPARFYPLIAERGWLNMVDGQIRAEADLLHPYSGKEIIDLTVNHDLDTGSGNAELVVADIRFDEDLQPEELTPLTEGVIAIVFGNLNGVGNIAWSRDSDVVSTGLFNIVDTDLAAPFGPVEGLNTTVRFTDLLALGTAPGQVASVERIDAGIEVFDGTIVYQLLPDQLVAVEAGDWPFMGGRLVLQPTVIDFGGGQSKRLTFEVIGFDGEVFIDTLDIDVIDLTGIFDGVIPLIFDESGGRIVGGRLDSRGGGILRYSGPIDRDNLGLIRELAFDLVRELNYEMMVVRFDGDLDGEFASTLDIERVTFGRSTAASILDAFTNVPINLNVNIAAPFRALLATLQSFREPQPVIEQILPGNLGDIPGAEIVTRKLETEGETEPEPEQEASPRDAARQEEEVQ